MKDQDTLILEQLYMEMSESKKVISLADIYGDIDEIPENEALYYEVDEDIFWVKIPVKVMSPDELKKLTTYQGDMTVLEAYQDFADKEQKNIVKHYVKHKKELVENPIIVNVTTALDGYHRIIAAILSNTSLEVLDISDIQ